MNKHLKAIVSDLRKPYNRLLDWYFTKKALPYWTVLALGCLICYLSGLFVLLLFTSAESIIAHFGAASRTILIYMIFNLIGQEISLSFSATQHCGILT